MDWTGILFLSVGPDFMSREEQTGKLRSQSQTINIEIQRSQLIISILTIRCHMMITITF